MTRSVSNGLKSAAIQCSVSSEAAAPDDYAHDYVHMKDETMQVRRTIARLRQHGAASTRGESSSMEPSAVDERSGERFAEAQRMSRTSENVPVLYEPVSARNGGAAAAG